MAIKRLVLTETQEGLDRMRALIKCFRIEVVVVKAGYYEDNPYMKYEEWKLNGDESEVKRFMVLLDHLEDIANSHR